MFIAENSADLHQDVLIDTMVKSIIGENIERAWLSKNQARADQISLTETTTDSPLVLCIRPVLRRAAVP